MTADRNEALSQPLSFTGNNQQAATNNPSPLASPAYLTPRLPKSLFSSQLSLFPSLPQPTLQLLAVSKDEKHCFTLGLILAEPPGTPVPPHHLGDFGLVFVPLTPQIAQVLYKMTQAG